MNWGMRDKYIKKYICLIYPLAVFIYFLHLFFSSVRTGVALTFVLALGAVGICVLGYFTVRTTEDKIFTVYLLYNLISGVWCVYYGMPVSVFLGEVSTTALPMVFYYAGRGFDDTEAEGFYHSFILAVLFMGGIGAVLNIWAPQFYLDFSYDNSFISVADAQTARVRMESLIGSGAMGCFAAYSMCASAFFLTKKDRKKRVTGIVYMLLSLLFTFMANQRSAMFSVILMLVFFNIVVFHTENGLHKRYLWIETAAIAAFLAGIFVFAREIFDKFWIRLASIPSGFGERTGFWVNVVNRTHNIWLGDGLGSRGHRAAEYQQYIVADGGLVKLYVEMGLIGTSLIIFVVSLVYIKSIKKANKVIAEIAIITSAILMSIGSNVLEIELCTPIVYMALGRAVKKLNEVDIT